MTPKPATLRDVVGSLSTRRGERETQRSGAAGEASGATRPWSFGDTERWDVSRTLLNAEMRHAAGDDRILDVQDVEIVETEQRTRAAVALCVDLSWSMYAEGRWASMKQTALALAHLIATRYPQDALQVIGFGRTAHALTTAELAAVEPGHTQGTNLQHALALARRHVGRHPTSQPVVLVVTDGEPTAHLEPDGEAAILVRHVVAVVRVAVAYLRRGEGQAHLARRRRRDRRRPRRGRADASQRRPGRG